MVGTGNMALCLVDQENSLRVLVHGSLKDERAEMDNNDWVTRTSDHSDHDRSQDDLDTENGEGDMEDHRNQDEDQVEGHSRDHRN